MAGERLLPLVVRGVLRHPSLLTRARAKGTGPTGWYGALRDLAIESIQTDYFHDHPDGRIDVGGVTLFLHPRRHLLSALVIVRGEHEPRTTRLIRSLLGNGGTLVDVGANIGWFTLVPATAATRVFAYEPDPENFAILQRAIAANGRANVTAQQLAISNTDGEATLSISEASAGFHSIVRQVGSRSLTVPVRRLDTALPDLDIDVLKVDVEGAEPHVLEGALGLLRKGKIRHIVLEWNPAAWTGKMEILRPFRTTLIDGTTPFAPGTVPPEGNVLLTPAP